MNLPDVIATTLVIVTINNLLIAWMGGRAFDAIRKRLDKLEAFKTVTVDKWLHARPQRGELTPTTPDPATMSPEAREYIIDMNVRHGMSREAAEKLFEMNYGKPSTETSCAPSLPT